MKQSIDYQSHSNKSRKKDFCNVIHILFRTTSQPKTFYRAVLLQSLQYNTIFLV